MLLRIINGYTHPLVMPALVQDNHYCNNNPVNAIDPSGHALLRVSGVDEVNLLALPWERSGGGGGGYCGGGSSQYEDIFEELDAIKDKTLDVICSVAEYCWDAYMREQNTQMQETQLMLDGAIAIYTYLDETEIISTTKWGVNTYNAARHGKIALAYLAAPIPTPVDEYLAVCHGLKPLYHLYLAGKEIIQ